MYCGGCGNEVSEASKFCAHCGQATISASGAPAYFHKELMNDGNFAAADFIDRRFLSNQEFLASGNDPAALPEMKGWNWGAFYLSWIWAFSHEQMAAGVIILVGSFIPFVGFIIRWSFKFYLGNKGSELAWRSRRFESVSKFRETQRAWALWGGIIFWTHVTALCVFMTYMMYDASK